MRNDIVSADGVKREVTKYFHELIETGVYEVDVFDCAAAVREIIENEKLRNSWFKNTDAIYTKTKDSPPAFYASSAKVANSIVADGCRVEGNIKNCVLSRFVKIGKGAKLENCIILQGTTVGEGAQLSNVIVEKNNIVNPYTQIVGTRDFPIVIEHKNTSAMFDASPQLEIYK